MQYVYRNAFHKDDLETLMAVDVEDAWDMLARDMRDDLPDSWTYDILLYVSHVEEPDGMITVTFSAPDHDNDQFEENYPYVARKD